ncbi:MAG: BamA/TamA family outer membrane protein [Bacteroidota bacterium]|nr:BamA/TamA family outer membrane protein [Bacteroidota bacterium]
MAALAALMLLAGADPSAATGQWQVIISGGHEDWSAEREWPADSVGWAARHALHLLQQDGFLFAAIATEDSAANRVEISKGEQGRVGQVFLEGVTALDAAAMSTWLSQQAGQPLTADTLEGLIAAILDQYARQGYHLTTAAIRAIVPATPPEVDVVIGITEQPRPKLSHIQVTGAQRTHVGVLHHIARLVPTQPLLDYNPARIRTRLERSGLFARVDSVGLFLSADSMLIMHVSAVEASPGSFDLALGYERTAGGSGALVGSGHLTLQNLFGEARQLAITLHRLPGQVSRINMMAADPYLFGLPLGLAAEFRGLQQDSTFSKRDYQLELGYELDGGAQLFGLVSREVTRPGLNGLTVLDGRQRVPVAAATLAGAGIRIRQVDHRYNPTQGYVVEMAIESGFKHAEGEVVRADTVREYRKLRLARLSAHTRVYMPHGQRRILVTGGEVRLLHAKEFDESDLFRFGGAASLRGYDEDRFRSPLVARLLLEYRYTFDTLTYGFVFADLGYVDASRTREGLKGLYPGFGVGFQLNTQAGLISLTLAANSEDPAAVRAHVRLSLGL